MHWITLLENIKTIGCGKIISKDNLKGKFITYLDRRGKYRTHKVTKVSGLTLTVKNCLGERHRIHPKHNLIFGRQMKHEIIPIQWTKDNLPLNGQKRPIESKTKKVVYNE